MRTPLFAAGAALALVGCASTSPNPSYADVSKLVEQRGGSAPHWDQHSPEDDEVEARLRQLLGHDLTPDAAVEVALLRNRALVATYQSVGVAQADLVQAGLLQNPRFGASVGFHLSGDGATALAGSLTEDFLSLFTIPLRKRFAERALEEAKLRVGAAVLELDADVRAAFVRLQAAQQAAELMRTIVEAEQSSSELAERQYQAGNIPELELVNRRAVYEQERLDLARAENETLEARETLNRLMGVWGPQADWTVNSTLAEVPAQELALEHLESRAIAQRLDLAAARAETEGVGQALSLASGTRLLTDLEVGVEAERDPEGNRTVGPSLALELPIFDQHQAKVARLEAQFREARARQEELAIDIRSQVRLATLHLGAQRAIALHYRKVLLPMRERVVQLSQEKYNAMLLGVFGLLQAKQSEVSAYREYIVAIRDYWLARIDLERALGGRLPASPSPTTQTEALHSEATARTK